MACAATSIRISAPATSGNTTARRSCCCVNGNDRGVSYGSPVTGLALAPQGGNHIDSAAHQPARQQVGAVPMQKLIWIMLTLLPSLALDDNLTARFALHPAPHIRSLQA